MPFYGIAPNRQHIFAGYTPKSDVAVSDAEAWRLNPRHRWIYNKLELALLQHLLAAPLGVPPSSLGIAETDIVFIKPIINLWGLSRGAQPVLVQQIPEYPGYMWSSYLRGEHTSSDVLVQNGQALWFAHTIASVEKDQERALYWQIGVDRSAVETLLTDWIAKHLSDYTGLCNFEIIENVIIEAHLRGSNGFLEFYGSDWLSSWVHLVDENQWQAPPPIPGGFVISVFTQNQQPLSINTTDLALWTTPTLSIQLDLDNENRPQAGRAAIIRSHDLAEGLQVQKALHKMLQDLQVSRKAS